MKTLCTRILMAAALMGTLMTSDAAEAEADVSGPASKEGNGSGDDAAELAKKLQNPTANLISVPIQNNWDFGIGPEDAMRYLVNVQPVIPFSLNQDWNLITRTIVPFIHMESPVPDGDDTGGIGDILQSFFFSPKDPVGGWIVGGGRCSSTPRPPTMRSAPRNGARARPPSCWNRNKAGPTVC